MIPILCALASAVALFLAHGTADVRLLAWVAPIPILWLAFGREPGRRVALLAAISYFVGQAGMLWPYYSALGFVVVIAAAIPALAFAAIVLAARLGARRLPPAAAVLVFPCLWTGWELLSASLSPHGTFGSWAYSQVDVPVLVQSASLFGLWVITFLIALFAAATAFTIRRRAPNALAFACALVIANLMYGALRLHRPEGATIRVAASARNHDDHASPAQVAIAQSAEVRRLAAFGARVVVFDEKAALLAETQRDSILLPLVSAARDTKTIVVSGFDQTGASRRNTADAILEDGRVQIYTKRHHIPGLESSYVVGDKPGLLGDGMATAICKDLDFPGTLRGDVAAGVAQGGVNLMLVPAWDFNADGWLHARMAILRGIEGGYAMVRAAANGLVTVSDAEGRLRAVRASEGGGGYLSVMADVPLGTGPTLYVRIGDAFAWVAAAAGLLLLAWSLWTRAASEEVPVGAVER
jgi:apolipoprotein N-acyltransferase